MQGKIVILLYRNIVSLKIINIFVKHLKQNFKKITMRKSLLIISLLVIVSLSVKAQERYIIISGGLTKPLSDFASSNFDNSEAGFATDGYNFGFELANFFSPWFGLGGSFKFNNAGFNSQVYNDVLSERYDNRFDTIYISSGDYSLHNFLAGPYGKIDMGDHLSIFAKTFIGVMSSFRPDQSLVYRNYGDLEDSYLFSEGKLTGAFAWNFGAGINIKITNSFSIIALADYIAANPKFDVYDYETVQFVKETQAVRYVNYNLGIALSL